MLQQQQFGYKTGKHDSQTAFPTEGLGMFCMKRGPRKKETQIQNSLYEFFFTNINQ